MQTKLIDDFIKLYKQSFIKDFDNSTQGKLERIKALLCEPKMHQSPAFKKELDYLSLSLDKPIRVGVIGQFSSGKSSLLNIILQKDILATGVVPVTSKPCSLKYAKDYALGVKLEDNSYELLSVDALNSFSDQRKSLKSAKALNIYAPVKLLKKINFIDTPGLDANELDNKASKNEFSKMHLIIWLSLIDNAGKKSEEDEIKKALLGFKNNSLCILNGKDKLSKDELSLVLKHAKSVFSPYFKEIIALSCKEAKTDLKKSNFSSFYDFLDQIDIKSLKKDFLKRRLSFLCQSQQDQFDIFNNSYNELLAIFAKLEARLDMDYEKIENEIQILQKEILNALKAIATKIANESLAFIKTKQAFYYKKSKAFLHKDKFDRFSYETPFLPADDAFLAMFYNKDTMNKEFKSVNYKLKEKIEKLKQIFIDIFTNYSKDILHYEAKYSNILRDDDLQSEYNFGLLRSFASSSNELFIKDFKDILNATLMKNELFFEKLNLKAFTNYQNAAKLSLNFFSAKINASREFYELDNSSFSLYYPELNELYERLLNELEVYEFEALLIDKSVLLRNYKNFIFDYKELIAKKSKLINNEKNEIKEKEKLLIHIKKEEF